MKNIRAMVMAIGLPLAALAIILGILAAGSAQAAPPARPLHSPGDCVVTTTADSGTGSLRSCIAQLAPGDTITFSTSVFPPASPATIALASALPDIATDNVTIDGSSAGVILDGSGTPGGTNGLVIDGASNVVVKGLQIRRFPQHGIELRNGASNNTIGGANATPGGSCTGDCNLISGNRWNGVNIYGSGTMSNTVKGNYIGTNVSGTSAISNGAKGIAITNGASFNVIGGNSAGERNVLSGNKGEGVLIYSSATSNTVKGNYIGTNASGTAAIANNSGGVDINRASYNVVGGNNATPGGPCTGDCNLISGNRDDNAISIFEGDASYNIVSGNYIGTNVSGTAAISNTNSGVLIRTDAQYNVIGGDTAAERNLISGNGYEGVDIYDSGAMSNTVKGNYIGTNVSGTAAIGNGYRGVEIHGGASYNVIGGSRATGKGNLISGNGLDGIGIYGSDTMSNTIKGNNIGTDASGTYAIRNGEAGISGEGSYNTIGGPTADERNLISGNGADETRNGINLYNTAAYYTIQGNYIGTNLAGTAVITSPNEGIRLGDDSHHNLVTGNVIGGNRTNGIGIENDDNTISNNRIGTDVSGTYALPNDLGVDIRQGAYGNVITKNLISGNQGLGVHIHDNGTNNNQVQGNHIGTNITGTGSISNGAHGISIVNGAQYNLIGGSNATPGGACTGECNLISSNSNGVWIEGSDTTSNTVSGNYIGSDVNGTAALGNVDDGIWGGGGARYNVIGGTAAGERNIISGNGGEGVEISGAGSNNNRVIGNYIGTDVTGSTDLGNAGRGIGINSGGMADGAKQNIIEKNVISGNDWNGMDIWGTGTESNTVRDNYIGTNSSGNGALTNQGRGIAIGGGAKNNFIGTGNIIAYNGYTGVGVGWMGSATINNKITQNSIYSNTYKGIELINGGNMELFPPILADVSTNTVKGLAPTNSTVEIFSDAEDEGRYFHSFVVADSSGNFTFTQANAFTGTNVTATATDGDGNTSEFSSPYAPLVDARVIAILEPKSGGKQGQTVTPTVKIGNAGTTAETGINVSVEASGPSLNSSYGPHSKTADLPPLGYATLSFQPLTPDNTGTYNFTATVTLAGDQDASNDVQTATVAVASDVIDLWTRDNEADVGDIPAYPFWQSPDIWVRNNDDGGMAHQDPIANRQNWVYFIVRNRGTAASSGADTAKAYWHQPSLGIKCGDWAQIDTGKTIASIPANNGSQLLKFTWTPTRTGHTCLHGEINSNDDPIVNPCDVPWDNNLSQRNVDIIPGGAGIGAQAVGGMAIEVTNVKLAPKPISIIIDVSNVPDANAVRLDLGSELSARWANVDGFGKSSGIAWSGGSIITVTNASSGTIAGIPMYASETQTVTLLVNAPSVETTTVAIREEIDSGSGVLLVDGTIGGNTYVFNTPKVYLPIIRKKSK
jgi:hypothetical protein